MRPSRVPARLVHPVPRLTVRALAPRGVASVAALGLALAAACGSSEAPRAQMPSAGSASVDGASVGPPGRAAHFSSVEEMTRLAAQVLATRFGLTPNAAPDLHGVVTTEWERPDPAHRSELGVRVVVEITDDTVVVHVQCRRDSGVCSPDLPEVAPLAGRGQRIADAIIDASPAERLLIAFRGFKDQLCGCADRTCSDAVEATMMRWFMDHKELAGIKPTSAQEAEADRIDADWDACKERQRPASSTGAGAGARDLAEPTGSAECDAYLETFDAVVVACRTEFGPALDAMQQARDAQAEAFREWRTLDEASRQAALDAARPGCLSATDALRQSAAAMGCAI